MMGIAQHKRPGSNPPPSVPKPPPPRNPPPARARECKCNMITKLVGDGCDVCNPEYAAQFADDPAEAQAQGGGEVCIRLPGVGEGGPYPVVDGVCVLPPSVTRRLVASAVGREMKREAMAQWAATAPPSAPVGVEAFTEKHCVDLRGITVGEVLTQDQWEAVCAFVREQEAIIDDRDERLEAPAQQPAACVGCEGKPSPENTPCAVCGQQPAAEPTNEAVAMFRRFLNGKQPVDGKITMKQARHILREWPGQQPAAVDKAWLSKARELYDRCKLWPENSSDGFMALLDLRNHVGAALAAQPGGSDNDQ